MHRHARYVLLPGGLRAGMNFIRRVRGDLPSFGQGRSIKVSMISRSLAKKQPFTAAMFTIYLLSLIGVPLTAGFFGKFYIFKAALDSHLVWLSVLGLLNSAVGAFYYLRVMVMMYMHEPGEGASSVKPLAPSMRIALLLPAIGTLFLGIFPTWLLEFASRSAVSLK